MPLIRRRPAPPLDRFVDWLWWSRREAPLILGEHMLPSGGAQLIIALHEEPLFCRPSLGAAPIAWSGGVVHGPQTQYYVAGPKPQGAVVGASFRPGAAGAVLGASLAELAGRHVALEAIWGADGRDLHSRLMAAATPEEIFPMLEEALRARIRRPLLLNPGVAQALAAAVPRGLGGERVADVQRASGYSARGFIAMFHATVGLHPKRYFRIKRLNRAVQSLAAGRERSLADVAAAAGYADQAHMTREFKALAGVSPSKYRPLGSDRPLHHVASEAALLAQGQYSSRQPRWG